MFHWVLIFLIVTLLFAVLLFSGPINYFPGRHVIARMGLSRMHLIMICLPVVGWFWFWVIAFTPWPHQQAGLRPAQGD